MKLCSVPDCGKPARTLSAAHCKMHYHRLYRNGSLEKVKTRKDVLVHSQGYLVRYADCHPLCLGRGARYEYEHRLVYFNRHGEGPFSCHWCGMEVTWAALHIDHLDDDKKNNDLVNLVASCAFCNQARGRDKQRDAMRAMGHRLTLNGKSMCLSEWSREIGLSRPSILNRLRNGWSVERALTEPRGKFGPKKREL